MIRFSPRGGSAYLTPGAPSPSRNSKTLNTYGPESWNSESAVMRDTRVIVIAILSLRRRNHDFSFLVPVTGNNFCHTRNRLHACYAGDTVLLAETWSALRVCEQECFAKFEYIDIGLGISKPYLTRKALTRTRLVHRELLATSCVKAMRRRERGERVRGSDSQVTSHQ